MTTKYFSLTLTLAIVFMGSTVGQTPMQDQTPAKAIPDFKFSRLDQTPFSKKDLAQGKLLFFFFFDSGCEHCQQTMRNIDRNYRSFQKTENYLISTDDHDKVKSFLATWSQHLKDQTNVVLLLDNLNQFIPKFKPVRYPAMYLYSPDGKLIDYEDNEETVFRIVNAIEKMSGNITPNARF